MFNFFKVLKSDKDWLRLAFGIFKSWVFLACIVFILYWIKVLPIPNHYYIVVIVYGLWLALVMATIIVAKPSTQQFGIALLLTGIWAVTALIWGQGWQRLGGIGGDPHFFRLPWFLIQYSNQVTSLYVNHADFWTWLQSGILWLIINMFLALFIIRMRHGNSIRNQH